MCVILLKEVVIVSYLSAYLITEAICNSRKHCNSYVISKETGKENILIDVNSVLKIELQRNGIMGSK